MPETIITLKSMREEISNAEQQLEWLLLEMQKKWTAHNFSYNPDSNDDPNIKHDKPFDGTSFSLGQGSRYNTRYSNAPQQDAVNPQIFESSFTKLTAELTAEQIGHSLRNTVIALGKKHVDKDYGSTLVSSFVRINQNGKKEIITANVGDSRALLISKGKDGKFVAQPLNYLHKPNDPKEKQRIRELGGAVVNGYLEESLAVSRAIGDAGISDALIYGPGISYVELPAETEEAYLINCSDGITDILNEKIIEAFFNNAAIRKEMLNHPHGIADYIRQRAYKSMPWCSTNFFGVTIEGPKEPIDNMSIVVTDLSKITNNHSVINTVADGHGANAHTLSQALVAEMPQEFKLRMLIARKRNAILTKDGKEAINPDTNLVFGQKSKLKNLNSIEEKVNKGTALTEQEYKFLTEPFLNDAKQNTQKATQNDAKQKIEKAAQNDAKPNTEKATQEPKKSAKKVIFAERPTLHQITPAAALQADPKKSQKDEKDQTTTCYLPIYVTNIKNFEKGDNQQRRKIILEEIKLAAQKKQLYFATTFEQGIKGFGESAAAYPPVIVEVKLPKHFIPSAEKPVLETVSTWDVDGLTENAILSMTSVIYASVTTLNYSAIISEESVFSKKEDFCIKYDSKGDSSLTYLKAAQTVSLAPQAEQPPIAKQTIPNQTKSFNQTSVANAKSEQLADEKYRLDNAIRLASSSKNDNQAQLVAWKDKNTKKIVLTSDEIQQLASIEKTLAQEFKNRLIRMQEEVHSDYAKPLTNTHLYKDLVSKLERWKNIGYPVAYEILLDLEMSENEFAFRKQEHRLAKALKLTEQATIPNISALREQLAELHAKHINNEILLQTELDQLDSIERLLLQNPNKDVDGRKTIAQTNEQQTANATVATLDFTERVEVSSQPGIIPQANPLAPKQKAGDTQKVGDNFIDLTLPEDLVPESESKPMVISYPIIEKLSQNDKVLQEIHLLFNKIKDEQLKDCATKIYNELNQLVIAVKSDSTPSATIKFDKTKELLSATKDFLVLLSISGTKEGVKTAVKSYEKNLNNALATSTWDKFVRCINNILHSLGIIKTLHSLESTVRTISKPLNEMVKLSASKPSLFSKSNTVDNPTPSAPPESSFRKGR